MTDTRRHFEFVGDVRPTGPEEPSYGCFCELTRRDRRPIFSRAPLTCPRVFVYAACDFCSNALSRPAGALATEVFTGRVVRVRGHMDDAALCGRAVKKSSASRVLMAVDCVEELAIFIRGAALPMHNFPCIILAVLKINPPGFCRVNFFRASARRHGNSVVRFRLTRKRYCCGIYHKRSHIKCLTMPMKLSPR